MKVTYDSNNSGGSWWLKDEDWKELEKAGWKVAWGSYSKKCKTAEEAEENRCLGALATSASKNFKTVREAMEEFEKITGQDVTEEGCNCCGAPHHFEWSTKEDKYNFASGDDCAQYLYGDTGSLSKRELLDRIK